MTAAVPLTRIAGQGVHGEAMAENTGGQYDGVTVKIDQAIEETRQDKGLRHGSDVL
ncbi:hypothetical protein [Rossellomorea marisflavi]|uniref:hypothetical protein n=1 Tax=Rossellomorea marisflavi TaxID=189381 RepID=UPI0015C42EA8|nr:hypothetical protein [Rossellomorea marisflavi]